MKFHIGHGYDVHPLAKGESLILGGVSIPNSYGLKGHSDADVLTHAIIDALLGAAGMGDIGTLYPDTDPAYNGISSILLLQDVLERIDNAGWAVGNIDATIIAQKPKLSPFIPEMRKSIAAALRIEISDVNIKATTEEKLGFTGRGEGISSHAVALLYQRS